MDGPSGAIAPAFTANYDVIAGRVSRGEDILIEEGPDDICTPLLNDAEPHCWRDSVTERDRLAASELGELLPGPIQTGARMTLVPKIVQDMRKAFAANDIRAACSGCEWSALCSGISAKRFDGTRVHFQERR